ncbi:MAG: KilA-N domain-containing protein [Moheibacter sp.]
MSKEKRTKIDVKGSEITVLTGDEMDFISLTDMVKGFDGGSALIEQWLKNKDTVLFLGVWEQLNNPDFNSPEFEGIKNEAGRNSFYLSAKKWIEITNAIGLKASAGRYGGTYAHKDIAFEFGSWLSPEFKLFLIKEFQRLKDEENKRLSLEWNLNRTLSKINYRIHTDAIKENIIPRNVSADQKDFIYAGEADLLNIALYGQTAKQWRKSNPDKKGNIRDYSTVEQLLVLANLESLNAEFIRMKLEPQDRLKKLNQIAISQMKSLIQSAEIKRLK